jgi:hypothetical protein
MMFRHAARWLPLAVCLCLAGGSADAATWYVDRDNAALARDGKSWATAFTTIQPAIEAAYGAGGGEVWVAEGVYNEERTSQIHFPRVNTGSLVMRPGVSLYGGFAGTETARAQRDWLARLAVIDGSRAQMGLPALHVVVAASNAALDGFVVVGGRSVTAPVGYSPNMALGAGLFADGVTLQVANCYFALNESVANGGAIYANGGTGAVSDCSFEENIAVSGAALYVRGGSLTVSDCQFQLNAASSLGGAVRNEGAELTVESCIFSRNAAVSGGAIYGSAGRVAIAGSAFRVNSATATGGAVHVQQATLSTLDGCTFMGNRAAGGGGVYVQAAQVQIDACGFFGNEAGAGGGGALKTVSSNPATLDDPINAVVNCVFWRNGASILGGALNCDLSRLDLVNSTFDGNRLIAEDAIPAPDEPPAEPVPGATLHINTTKDVPAIAAQNCVFTGLPETEFSLPQGGLELTYCLVEGGYEGIGNVDAVPQFAAADAGDLRLVAGSPGLNAGAANAVAQDYLGVPRPQDGLFDMGAFERLVNALDSDGDGIPNAYELGDTDGDGKPNVLDTDSDNDGLADAAEGMMDVDGDGAANFVDTDSDDDGVDDALEHRLGMNVYAPDDLEGDPDGDGLTTEEEIELGTRPYELDSDGDGMPDGWEVEYELNPLVADGLLDADRDGVRNVDEFLLGTDVLDPADPPRDMFVSPTGSDVAGDGTFDKPWKTIAWANSIRNAARFYAVRDVTIHLAEGLYEEPVTLLPNVSIVGASPEKTTLQYFKAGAAEHVVVWGAEGAALRNLRIKATGSATVASSLVKIDGVAMELSNVVFDGNFVPYTEGLRISGSKSSGSVVRDCVFRRLDRGAVAENSGAVFTANSFEDILNDAVFVRSPETEEAVEGEEPEPLVAPRFGLAGAVETTGLNRFRNVFRYAVLNVGTVPVAAENNDWGVYSQADVERKFAGAVDAMPYMGTALSPGTLVIQLRAAATGEPVDPAENPQVALAAPAAVGVRDAASGLWLVPGVPLGTRIVSATADGYAVGVRAVTLTRAGVTGLDMSLLAEGVIDPANVDRLGGINAMDVQLVIRRALGASIPFVDADVDGDGKVNARDVQLVIAAVLRGGS